MAKIYTMNGWKFIIPPDQPVDLSGWKIYDDQDFDTIPNQANPIPAFGYALITDMPSTWQYWNIPDGVIKIALNSSIGFGLSNTKDMLILKDPAGNIVDQMNWGVPDTSWPNYNSGVWKPGVVNIAMGHELARVPSGFDSDQPSDWHDLALPEVKVLVPNGGETWIVGHTYTIKWQASNANGPNSDLKIDIYYSNDSGHTWGNIIMGTENDGQFDWNVPLYLGSYFVVSHKARIKVVATGPENFMASAWDISDRDFCPPIDYSAISDLEKYQVQQLLKDGTISMDDVENYQEEEIILDQCPANLDFNSLENNNTQTLDNPSEPQVEGASIDNNDSLNTESVSSPAV